jgi:hypothetical protein
MRIALTPGFCLVSLAATAAPHSKDNTKPDANGPNRSGHGRKLSLALGQRLDFSPQPSTAVNSLLTTEVLNP